MFDSDYLLSDFIHGSDGMLICRLTLLLRYFSLQLRPYLTSNLPSLPCPSLPSLPSLSLLHLPLFLYLLYFTLLTPLNCALTNSPSHTLQILSLPHAYAPRLDAAVHIRNSFQNFEKSTNISDIGNTNMILFDAIFLCVITLS